VAIVQYGSRARLVLEHTPASDRKRLRAAIEALQCNGSTNLEAGMRLAYATARGGFVPGAENRVLLLSDGVANLGEGDPDVLLATVAESRKQGIFCSVLGFGAGNVNDAMLEALANRGDGAYTFVDGMAEARRVLVDDLAATLNTIAADVKIQVQFDPARVRRYRQLGYENRRLRDEDFRNDAVDAGEVGSGQSVTALYELDLAAARSGSLGTVRVRYRRTDNGQVEEIEHAIRAEALSNSFDNATVRLRLAACAAEFAEILRGSPHAAGSSFRDVARALRPVALELNLDSNVQEFLRLVETAQGLTR